MLLTRLRRLLPEEEVWFYAPSFLPLSSMGVIFFFASSIELCQEIGDSLARLEAAATLPKIKSGGGSDDRRRRKGIANDLFKRATHFHRPSLAVSTSVARQKGVEHAQVLVL